METCTLTSETCTLTSETIFISLRYSLTNGRKLAFVGLAQFLECLIKMVEDIA
jgi:copper oxidase (laccase) domain-containing protein